MAEGFWEHSLVYQADDGKERCGQCGSAECILTYNDAHGCRWHYCKPHAWEFLREWGMNDEQLRGTKSGWRKGQRFIVTARPPDPD